MLLGAASIPLSPLLQESWVQGTAPVLAVMTKADSQTQDRVQVRLECQLAECAAHICFCQLLHVQTCGLNILGEMPYQELLKHQGHILLSMHSRVANTEDRAVLAACVPLCQAVTRTLDQGSTCLDSRRPVSMIG